MKFLNLEQVENIQNCEENKKKNTDGYCCQIKNGDVQIIWKSGDWRDDSVSNMLVTQSQR